MIAERKGSASDSSQTVAEALGRVQLDVGNECSFVTMDTGMEVTCCQVCKECLKYHTNSSHTGFSTTQGMELASCQNYPSMDAVAITVKSLSAPSKLPCSCACADSCYGGQKCRSIVENSSEQSLEDLPMDLLVKVMSAVAAVGVDSVAHLGATSTKFHAAFELLLQQDPTVLWSVRQNQQIFQELQVQLSRERNRRKRPTCLVTEQWTNQSGAPSICRILFEWPASFPYFPACVCCAFAVFLTVFSLLRLEAGNKIGERIVLACLVNYGAVIGVIGFFCPLYACVSHQFFLAGLSVLFSLVLGIHGCLVASSSLSFILEEKQVANLSIALVFGISLWFLLKHMWADFRPGFQKTNALGSLVFSAFTAIYFLMYSASASS